MRFANIAAVTRFYLSLLCLLGCTFVGCGVNETISSDEVVFYPLPAEYHIKDEYFIAVHPATKHPEHGKNGMEVVQRALAEIFYPRKSTQLTDIEGWLIEAKKHIIGCGGSTDPATYQHDNNDIFCIRLPEPEENLKTLMRNDQIRYIEAHGRVVLTGVQACPPSWGLDQMDESHIGAGNGIYGYSKTGDGVHVFIIDTGIADHGDLSNRIGSGVYVDDLGVKGNRAAAINDMYGHGTMLAGIVAGSRTGIAKKAIVHPIRVFPSGGLMAPVPDMGVQIDMNVRASHNAVIQAIDQIKGTLDGGTWCSSPSQARLLLLPFTTESGLGLSLGDTVKKSIDECKWLVITGAGNDSQEISVAKPIPAFLEQVFTVGAYNEDNQFSGFSNRGAEIDILAPGDKIQTITPNGKAFLSGTSAAAAFVAGVAAQFLEDNPGANYIQIGDRLKGSAIRNAVEVPPGTPNLVLHSPYGDGTTGDTFEVDKVDAVNDGLFSSLCNDGNACNLRKYCDDNKTNKCTEGLKHLRARGPDLGSCNHGIDCSNGICRSCGLRDERCCSPGSPGDATCSDNLECSKFGRCTCGGMDEICCENGVCGAGYGCALSAMNKPICRPCGLVAGQPCCGNKCEREDMICVSTEDKNGNTWKTCKSCGGPGDPCCASPRNPCDPGYVCGSDPSNSSKSICLPCGSTNQNCCSNGPACAGSLQCLPNPTDLAKKTCQECGVPGKTCCASPRDPCSPGSICNNDNKCTPCGSTNQECCSSGPACAGSLQCLPNPTDLTKKTCQECGAPGKTCCASPRNPCGPGAICNSDNKCTPCGSTNQECCSSGPACAGSLQCLPNPTDLTKKTCQECGGPGQACCKSPRRACQGDMACDGGKCVGSCSVRCEYGGLSGKEGVQDHGACLRYAQTLCDSCDMKNDRIARVRYNGNYIFNLSTLCGTKERCCREDSTCDLGLKCTAIDVPQCGTGERKTCQ